MFYIYIYKTPPTQSETREINSKLQLRFCTARRGTIKKCLESLVCFMFGVHRRFEEWEGSMKRKKLML